MVDLSIAMLNYQRVMLVWKWVDLQYLLLYRIDHLVMTNIAMERSTISQNGKPSISIRAIYIMANC